MSGHAVTPLRDDIEPVAHETADRIITGSAMAIPFLALGVAGWQLWGRALSVTDVVLFVVFYVATCLGVTVGFHRHLTHRSFKTKRSVRVVLSLLGSAAVEGPVISWVADHRKHHAFSDHEGDPHSPHGHGGGFRGTARGLAHAHMGWMFVHDQRGKRSRYAPDLLADPALRFIDKTFLLWVAIGLALPFALGYAIGGTLVAGLTGLLWGGAVRMVVLHHVTFSINSLCHCFGRRRFDDLRRVAQPRLARAAVDGRGVAQQPSRLPDLGRARPARVGDRSVRAGDPRARGDRPGVGRAAHLARARGGALRGPLDEATARAGSVRGPAKSANGAKNSHRDGRAPRFTSPSTMAIPAARIWRCTGASASKKSQPRQLGRRAISQCAASGVSAGECRNQSGLPGVRSVQPVRSSRMSCCRSSSPVARSRASARSRAAASISVRAAIGVRSITTAEPVT